MLTQEELQAFNKVIKTLKKKCNNKHCPMCPMWEICQDLFGRTPHSLVQEVKQCLKQFTKATKIKVQDILQENKLNI